MQFYDNVAVSGSRQQGDTIAGPFGGAMCVQGSAATLRNVLFAGNRVEAVGTSAPAAIRPRAERWPCVRRRSCPFSLHCIVTLSNIVFQNNSANGGNGAVRGGFALGGALYTYKTIVVASQLEFRANSARAGWSSGQGRYANDNGLRCGGRGAFQVGSIVTLDDVTAYDNQAIGGAAAEKPAAPLVGPSRRRVRPGTPTP